MDIKLNKFGKFILKIDNFKGILRECLLMNIVNFDQKTNVYFEIFIDHTKKNKQQKYVNFED